MIGLILDTFNRLTYRIPGRPRQVTVVDSTLAGGGDTLDVPPLSVVLHVLPVR